MSIVIIKGTQNETDESSVLSDDPLRIDHHFPDHVPPTAKKINATRKCKVCSLKGLRRESRYYCAACNVALCVTPCFKKFHVETNM